MHIKKKGYKPVVFMVAIIFFIDYCSTPSTLNNSEAYAYGDGVSDRGIVALEEIINNHPQLKETDSIEKFLEFILRYKTELPVSSKRIVDNIFERLDPKDKTAMKLNYMAVSSDSEVFKILPPFGRLPVRVYRINYKNKWQVLILINSDIADLEYLKFALNQGIQYAVYLTRNELIRQRFPQTRVFELSSGAFLALGQFYYTIAIASAQYVPSLDSLMVDVVGWLTSGFPTGSRIRLLREVLPHEESHMRFFRLSKEEQDRVINSILNDLGTERIEQIYNTIGFWHEQDKPDYFTASEEMVKHPEWFEQNEMDMPGAKRAYLFKLSNGRYLNLAIFITEFLSTLSMDLESISSIYGVPQEFVNRLKALYDEKQGIGFNFEKELKPDTKKLLRDLRLIKLDISEHLSIISMQYPYLILEECWKGYFSDYDLEEVIGLSYAKKILAENGFDKDKIDMLRPIVKKYWLILTYQGQSLIVLEKIPTLNQWVILILASLYQKSPKDKTIEEITDNLKELSLHSFHLKNDVPLSFLISKKGTDRTDLNNLRARLIKEIMGELNNIGFMRRITRDAKTMDIPLLLSNTVLSKYICTLKGGEYLALRFALEEHIDKAIAERGTLSIDLDLDTLLYLDTKGNLHLKDIYFAEALTLLRTIAKDNLHIRLINFSGNFYRDRIEKALGLEQLPERVELTDGRNTDFKFEKEAIKILHDKNLTNLNGAEADIVIKGKKVYFENEEFEIIPAFDVFLSSLVVLCGKDKNFLKFLKEFLDTLPEKYKVFDKDNNLAGITLPEISGELITKEYLKKVKDTNDALVAY